MKKKFSNLFFVIAFLSGGSIAHADDTIAGVLFGSPNQSSAIGGVACSVTLSPSGASIRGELEIRDSGAYHISNVILR